MGNEKNKDYKKGESYLTKIGVIQKIGVYCYTVETEWIEVDGNYMSSDSENIIIIGINKEQLENSTKDHYNEDNGKDYTYKLEETFLLNKDEVAERFNLREFEIEQILNGENLELDCWGTDYYYYKILLRKYLLGNMIIRMKKIICHWDFRRWLKR